jgi:hypothetical protein
LTPHLVSNHTMALDHIKTKEANLHDQTTVVNEYRQIIMIMDVPPFDRMHRNTHPMKATPQPRTLPPPLPSRPVLPCRNMAAAAIHTRQRDMRTTNYW